MHKSINTLVGFGGKNSDSPEIIYILLKTDYPQTPYLRFKFNPNTAQIHAKLLEGKKKKHMAVQLYPCIQSVDEFEICCHLSGYRWYFV